MNPIPFFAATYAEARSRFLAAAAGRGLPVEAHVLPGILGAEGEVLATDLALLGPADAPTLLILTSATHGAEGFCGSGCQVALLHDDAFIAAVQASGSAVLLYHAVNPYGFSHLRRTNEDNVDLNRNFRSFDPPPAPNAAYAAIHAFMVPEAWPPAPANEAMIRDYIARHGLAALQAALSGGQCEFPDGLFFGGTRPTWSNGVLREAMRRHAAGREAVAWIDFHTALGPWGHGEKIYNGPLDGRTIARTRSTFGADLTSDYDGSSTSAKLTGVNHQAFVDACPGVAYAGIALEVGTVPLLQSLQALRADQWLHNHPAADPALRTSIKRAVREAFHGDTDDWKAMVYGQARVACLQALRGLATRFGEAVAP